MKHFSTDEAPAAEQADYWSAALASSFVKLDFEPTTSRSGRPFTGHIDQGSLAYVDVAVVNSRAQEVHRTSRLVRQEDADLFLISVQVAGRGELEQDGRQAVLSAGDCSLYDTTRPYHLSFRDDFEQLVLSIPRDRLRIRIPAADRLTAIPIRGVNGLGSLFFDLVTSIPRNLESMTAQVRESVSNSVLDLVATALAGLPSPIPAPASNLKQFHLNRIKSYVIENLSDAELDIARIAQTLGMSVSSLYRAFASEGCPLSQWIWDQRLHACRKALLDESCANLSAKQIAMSWGFNDPAHFSRAFRRKFGESPNALRTRK
ncbi:MULTISPECIES: helix-turn-helix domain-containing protein [Burkholderia]|uniref:AraC family regulatory protein n=3 Tax=Burkholderia cepacia complex TaxID=87882 RepID=B4E7T1_BURCJ|nr:MULTISPECIES: helix-turn-helix domain-containing protein [Burkholderia]KIS47422.1 helix-turn-helix domain protein [Burkholderia cepacia]AOJ93638.1 DNA-binding protein [Burkholderia multivorans]ERI26640.1 DNA-binding helix-turn-helix protein [Burkholderia cenocepacia BC7]MBU9283736.1 helix-turn-helix domain-containing protein [Burkholderia multivorans]MBU9348205.1 helix-turn-helix domain-containing protein [Burkholderia multivorans]